MAKTALPFPVIRWCRQGLGASDESMPSALVNLTSEPAAGNGSTAGKVVQDGAATVFAVADDVAREFGIDLAI